MKFKPTSLFYSSIETLKRILTYKEGLFSFVFFWLLSPLLPAIILGWFFAELTFSENWSK